MDNEIILFNDSEKWTENFLSQMGYIFNKEKRVMLGTTSLKQSDVVRQMKLEYDRQWRALLYKMGKDTPIRFSQELLELAFNKAADDAWCKFRDEAIATLSYVPGSSLDELDKLLAATIGPAFRPLDKAILAHWMWQVKRKMIRKTVKNHIMPIFIGKQGCGKSTAISEPHTQLTSATPGITT